MRDFNNAIENYFDKLNKQTQEDWNDRFVIVHLETKGKGEVSRLVRFKMFDTYLNLCHEDWAEYYWLGKHEMGFKIWDCFNNFVLECLKEEKTRNGS